MDMENMRDFGDNLGLKMWMGIVPSSETLPAIAFDHVSYKKARTADGSVGGTMDYWRLMVVANSYAEANATAQILRDADNMISAFYRTFHVTGEQLLLPDEGDSIYRIAMDIETT